ncbi:hypothetical protein [Gulosibacter sediminis]|uniref:hypothetical protein n=1 Tax=Gulosibacter sediminis TaxID=1729695 RepID=UPI0024A7C194|nr:hypothetical protein [Gulosibacter sediminis]
MRANLRHASGAIAALAAMTLLVGCSTSNTDSPGADANRPESDGSNMPFNLTASGGGSTTPDTGPTETTGSDSGSSSDSGSGSDSGSSGGSGGGDGTSVVKYGDVDLSDSNWTVTCMDDYLMASDIEGDDYSADNNSVSVSLDSDGNVDYVMVVPVEGSSLYYSSDLSESDPPKVSFEGMDFEVSGEAFLDYDTSNLAQFEITLTCDSKL